MKFYKAKVYWKDDPDVSLERVFCHLDKPEDELEKMEGLDIDDSIFYYLQDPEELTQLQREDNGEEFGIEMRSVEEITALEVIKNY